MKVKIAGTMVLLAATATVFATTNTSLHNFQKSAIHGVADIVESADSRLNLHMEFVGLEPGTLYVARMENTTCNNIQNQVPVQLNGLYVATFVESNPYGSYSSVLKGLPQQAHGARSVILYNANIDSEQQQVETLYCQNIG